MELQARASRLADLDSAALAISQEDADLESAAAFLDKFAEAPGFPVLADLGGERTTKAYDRATTYFIDEQGIVRQIFPMMIRKRAGWPAILAEIESLLAAPESDD